MSFRWPTPGLNDVPSYQVSGIPYVTRSVVNEVPAAPASIKVTFPFVTRFFHIACDAGSTENLRFGFTANGVKDAAGNYTSTSGSNNNFFVVKKGEEMPRMDIRCTEIYFAGNGDVSSFEIVAGLTRIPNSGSMSFITGSGGMAGVG